MNSEGYPVKAPTKVEGNAYRIVLFDPRSRCVLMRYDDFELRLIRIVTPPNSRVTKNLYDSLRACWGVRALIVDFLGPTPRSVAFAELLAPDMGPSFIKVNPESIASDELSTEERADLTAILDGAQLPVASCGWIDEAMNWVSDKVGCPLRPKHMLKQFNSGSGFTLLQISGDDDSRYWLKATGVPNRHERKLTHLLCRLSPDCLPAWLGERNDWNAWLTRGDATSLEKLPTDPTEVERLLGAAVDSLARIQAGAADDQVSLLNHGAFDQRLPALKAAAAPLFEFVAVAMSHQTSTRAPRIPVGRLNELRTLFLEACEHAESLRIPSTILHGDMNLGNIAFQDGTCRFLDWAEGYVGYPLIALQHLLLLNPIETPSVRLAVNERLCRRYCLILASSCQMDSLTKGLSSMAVIAAGSAMYSRGLWLQEAFTHEDRRFSRVRTIARYMDAAARNPAFLRALRA